MNELQASILFLVLFITSVAIEINTRIFIARTKRTRGTIIEIETEPRGEGYLTVTTIEYTTEKGGICQYRNEDGVGFFKNVGDQVNVYYDPKRPDKEVFIPNETLFVARVLGLIFLGGSLYWLIHYLK